MRNEELVKWNKLWKLKSQILPNCLHRKYGTQLGEFTNTSFVVFGAERVKLIYALEDPGNQTSDFDSLITVCLDRKTPLRRILSDNSVTCKTVWLKLNSKGKPNLYKFFCHKIPVSLCCSWVDNNSKLFSTLINLNSVVRH